MSYAAFLASKTRIRTLTGVGITAGSVHPMLHPWQAEIVIWAAMVGRAAIWADTGLGKTLMQIEWARLVGERVLIVAPLAVCQQTVREAAKVGVTAWYARSDEDAAGPGLWVTNYEMVERFDPKLLDAVVLDEASILKQSTGKTRTRLIHHFATVPFRLSCTATPAPNDTEELTNQAEFLGVMPRNEMLAAYYIHDSDGWRLKGHACRPMFRQMASWAIAIRRPSDLGYADDGYVLPGLEIRSHLIPTDVDLDIAGVGGRAKVRRATLAARCERAAELIGAEPDEPWLLWCGLNDEAEMLADLTGAVNVHGTLSPEAKAELLTAFSTGEIQRLVTKPSIAAFGLNWQHCARLAFVGLSDSYESYYQAIRRCYRYGQARVVHAHVVLSELEAPIAENVLRKEDQAAEIIAALVTEMRLAREELAA